MQRARGYIYAACGARISQYIKTGKWLKTAQNGLKRNAGNGAMQQRRRQKKSPDESGQGVNL